MKYLGNQKFILPDGSTFTGPVFDMVGFLNTEEGWNLYAQAGTPEGMAAYHEAKAIYNRINEITPCPEWDNIIEGERTCLS